MKHTKFTEDSYVFLTPNDPDECQYVKIIDPDLKYAGVIVKIDYIKIEEKGFKKQPLLSYHYNIIEYPINAMDDRKKFDIFVGDLILDIYDRFYR